MFLQVFFLSWNEQVKLVKNIQQNIGDYYCYDWCCYFLYWMVQGFVEEVNGNCDREFGIICYFNCCEN